MTIDEAHEFEEVSSYGYEVQLDYHGKSYFYSGGLVDFDVNSKDNWRDERAYKVALRDNAKLMGMTELIIFNGDEKVSDHKEYAENTEQASKWILTDKVFDGKTFWEAYPEIEWIDE